MPMRVVPSCTSSGRAVIRLFPLDGKCSRGIRMLSLDDAQKRAEKLVEAARKIGADAADALYICDASTQVQMRLGLLEDVERSEGEDIGLRVFSGRRSATVSSSDMSEARSEEHTSELQSLMRNSY